jgi:hypothetical protein
VEKIESFSPTRIGMLRRCSLQDFYRYKAGIIIKPDGNLTRGNAGHAGLDHNYVYKMEHGEDAPLDEVLDAYSDKFDELTEGTIFKEDEDVGEIKDLGVEAVKLHMKKVAPTIMPVEVETWLNIEFENVPYMVRQRGDIITVCGRVRDHKFTKRKIDPSAIGIDFQLSMYSLAYKIKYGEDPTEVCLDRMICAKKPDYQPLTGRRTQKDYDRALHILQYSYEIVRDNKYLPCDNYQNCKWCGYKPICWDKPWWKYIQEPELAQKEAKRLIAQKLAVGTVIKQEEETDE